MVTINPEKKELSQEDIDIRTNSIHRLIEAQQKRINEGRVNTSKGVITLLALEFLIKTLKKDVTVILPNERFARKFNSALGTCLNIMQVPAERIDQSTLWLWGRSRLMLTNPSYYAINKNKFWGSEVEEIRLTNLEGK